MKAQLLNNYFEDDKSFKAESHVFKSFLKIWHCHPEIELVVIKESTGTRFVGDNIGPFEPGDVVLLGENVPHLWLNDKSYFGADSGLWAKAEVIHIQEKFVQGLHMIPEAKSILELFRVAKKGIKFDKKYSGTIMAKVKKIGRFDSFMQYLHLLELLYFLSGLKDYNVLASDGYLYTFNEIKDSKMVKVHEHIMNNFKNKITLDEISSIANMHPAAFSRFFTHTHKKTFSCFLNEVRVGYACRLLIESKYNISGVCYEAGFNNLSNFNRKFKEVKKITPSEYLKKHKNFVVPVTPK